MKKAWPIIILLVIFFSFLGIAIARKLGDKTIYNTGYVNGNTAGNLYNAGLFCESNGTVFFSNPDDNGRLYAMDPSGSNLEKLSNDTVMYLNADNNYVYYVRDNTNGGSTSADGKPSFPYFSYNNNSLCRIDRDGKNCKILDEDPCIYATLIGNYIYYLHYDEDTATTLYKVKIDGTDRKMVSKNYMFTCSTDGQYFYTNGMQNDGNIYRFDTTNDTITSVYTCSSYKPIVMDGSNAYYLDVKKNNALVHLNLSVGTPTYLTTDSIDLYNVYGSTIFYQNYSGKNSALCMVRSDGSDKMVIAQGNFSCINVTSYYAYFTDYKTGQIYYTSTSNPGALLPFHPGILSKQ